MKKRLLMLIGIVVALSGFTLSAQQKQFKFSCFYESGNYSFTEPSYQQFALLGFKDAVENETTNDETWTLDYTNALFDSNTVIPKEGSSFPITMRVKSGFVNNGEIYVCQGNENFDMNLNRVVKIDVNGNIYDVVNIPIDNGYIYHMAYVPHENKVYYVLQTATGNLSYLYKAPLADLGNMELVSPIAEIFNDKVFSFTYVEQKNRFYFVSNDGKLYSLSLNGEKELCYDIQPGKFANPSANYSMPQIGSGLIWDSNYDMLVWSCPGNTNYDTLYSLPIEEQSSAIERIRIKGHINAIVPTIENTFVVGDLQYRITSKENRTVEVVQSESNSYNNVLKSNIVIPEKVTYSDIQYTVTSIGNGCFEGCTTITSIQIPETVTSIGIRAFSSCYNLIRVDMPNSLSSIGEEAFRWCSMLVSIVIPPSVKELGKQVFFGCDRIQKIVYPETLTADWYKGICITYNPNDVIYKDGFIYNTDKTELLFSPVYHNEEYIIPEGVVTIKSDAFWYADGNGATDNLATLTIPVSILEVEANAFKDITFNRVNFKDWSAWWENIKLGNVESNPYRNGAEIYAGDVNVTTPPTLKEGLTEIKDYVNIGLEYKGEIELPTTLKRVGAYAFVNNKELYHVFLNNKLEEIGDHAFAGCELLENPSFPETLNSLGDYAYQGCTSLTEIELPERLSELGKGVFSDCSKIEKAVLVADIDTLGDELFANCYLLNKIYFPLNLKHIGNKSFNQCCSLEQITFPSTLVSIGEDAFRGIENQYYKRGSLSKVVIPNSVKSIGKSAFRYQSIKDLKIGEGVEVISEGAFAENPLVSVNFSEGLKKIESEAFANNVSSFGEENIVSSVILPSTVTELEGNAFKGNAILEMIIPDDVMTLPAGSCGDPSVLTIGKNIKEIDSNAFGFKNLYTLRLKATMPPTLSDAFPLTDQLNDQLTLVVNQGRKNYYETNARWKQIENIIEEESADVVVYLDGTYSLAEEIRIQSGIMPSRVSKMKVVGPLSEADLRVIKENMVSLTSLDLSGVNNLTELPDEQFKNSLLAEIALPKNLKVIGNFAFSECRLLKMSELPETLETIGDYAFANCPRVSFIRLPETINSVGNHAFANCTGIREMTVGRKFTTNVGILSGCSLLEKVDLSASSIDKIDALAFADCYELDEIILPETVKSIEGAAFSNTAIRDLSFLSSGVQTINGKAFSDCRRLVAATLPKNSTKVPNNIFENCPRLLAVSMPSGVAEVGANLVNGDKKLANISCAAKDAPTAETGAFDNIRLRYVSLTVPTLSFRSYLQAPQWGKFETIQNRIPVEIDNGVDVTNVAETEYQDMLKEDRLEEQQLQAQEEDAQGEEPSQIIRRRAIRRAEARATTNRSFAALFDGAQIQTGSEGEGTRIFINPKEGVNVTSITLDGKEMLGQMEGNSILLPAGTNGTLVIKTDAPADPNTGMETIEVDFSEPYQIYDINGVMMGDDLNALDKGLYIVRQSGGVKKIVVK